MALNTACKALVFTSLCFACGHRQQPALSPAPLPPPDEYVTVIPEVTYSRTGQDAASEEASIAPDEDVMASILAIPPGQSARHNACSGCRAEDMP
jgi:hypothetical protein